MSGSASQNGSLRKRPDSSQFKKHAAVNEAATHSPTSSRGGARDRARIWPALKNRDHATGRGRRENTCDAWALIICPRPRQSVAKRVGRANSMPDHSRCGEIRDSLPTRQGDWAGAAKSARSRMSACVRAIAAREELSSSGRASIWPVDSTSPEDLARSPRGTVAGEANHRVGLW